MLRLPIAAIALSFAAATFASAEEAVRLKVMTFNIWYGGDQVNFAKVIEAIRAADADIVGLQEPDGKTLEIAAAAGYPYADTRRHILSRFPLFDSGSGETTFEGAPWYSVAGVDPDRVHAWAMVAPGKVVAVANTHLTSDPYGPELLRDGSSPEEVLANEADTRTPEAQALVDGLKPVIDTGVPVILTGDFNTPSHLDWTDAAVAARGLPVAVEWPTTRLLADAGFTDSYRAANPDPVARPGLTWTPGRPTPVIPEGETHDRIDHVQIANATALEATVVGESGNPRCGHRHYPLALRPPCRPRHDRGRARARTRAHHDRAAPGSVRRRRACQGPCSGRRQLVGLHRPARRRCGAGPDRNCRRVACGPADPSCFRPQASRPGPMTPFCWMPRVRNWRAMRLQSPPPMAWRP